VREFVPAFGPEFHRVFRHIAKIAIDAIKAPQMGNVNRLRTQ
jgi:hypothetical protein